MFEPTKPVLRLPKKLVFATLCCAVASVVACSDHTETLPGDASAGYDAPSACDGGDVAYCGGGPCPSEGAFYCMIGCPSGCEPFA